MFNLQAISGNPITSSPVPRNSERTEDIYANLDKQVKIAKIYREILEIRDKLMSNEDKNSSQTILAGPLHTDAAVTVIDKL